MPPVTSKKQPREPIAAAPLRGGGGGRGQGGRGKGNGNGKSNGKGYDVASSSAPTSDRRDIVVGNEDRAAKVRKIKHGVQTHRSGDDRIARALLAPTRGAGGDRVQLRYLQVAEDVVTNALFPNEDVSETSEGQGISPQSSSLLSSVSSGKRGDDTESVLSVLTVQSVMLMVKKFSSLHLLCINFPDRFFFLESRKESRCASSRNDQIKK